MTLEFGVFDHIEHLPGISLEQLYDERLEQIERLDQAGFYGYHLAEHHTPAVHSMAPSQNVFLSSVAQRTTQLRFGPCVYVLPLHHPIRLIEEISMLDHLSKGRLELGVGRGGVLEAFFWCQDSDPEVNEARYHETLAIVLEGLSHDELTYAGQFYDFDTVPMRLRPKQHPHPPLWYMRNPEVAALGGMNCIILGSLDRMEALALRYKRVWAATHGADTLTLQGTRPKIGLVIHILLADTDAEAIEIAKPAWDAYAWNLSTPRRLEAERRGLTQFIDRRDTGVRAVAKKAVPDRHRALEERRDLDAALAELDADEREARDSRRLSPGGLGSGVVVGSPDTVRVYLDEYAKCADVNYCVFSFQWGNLTHAQAMRSIQLFTEELMPRYVAHK